ncbi:hypothetical protein [Bacteroides graminisolvens]|uniref:hypothetical protein n=1 Tax=Bacteroides graminisolvens TaxID=477666 RepID=UPI002409A605|nr:hypothetical protein [Bacteroides graminisolvens]
MDEKRFKYIETKEEVLILLGKGERLFTHDMTEFYYDKKKEAVMRCDYCSRPVMTSMPINDLLYRGLYIKKPFDVREAMRERPNEWVGKFKDNVGLWYKVGFDSSQFRAIKVGLKSNLDVVHRQRYGTELAYAYDLDSCIPIDEVPKEES